MMYIEVTFDELWARLAGNDVVWTAQTSPIIIANMIFFIFENGHMNGRNLSVIIL
jgi:hypothetical protein